MARATKNRKLPGLVFGAAALSALAGMPADAAQTKAKEQPWPTHDDAASPAATGCEYMGAGYMKLPGSDTCVRISGYMRSESAILSR